MQLSNSGASILGARYVHCPVISLTSWFMSQYAFIIPETEWLALVADIEHLKQVVAELSPADAAAAPAAR